MHPSYSRTEETFTIKCDHLITAFGCDLESSWEKILPIENGKIKVDPYTMQSKLEWLFAGGDAVGVANLVDASNDGKTASWYIHKFIQNSHGIAIENEPRLPGFFTDIDCVDLSTEVIIFITIFYYFYRNKIYFLFA